MYHLPNYDNWLTFDNNPYEEDVEEDYYCKYCGSPVVADEENESTFCKFCSVETEAKPEKYWRL